MRSNGLAELAVMLNLVTAQEQAAFEQRMEALQVQAQSEAGLTALAG